MSSFLFREYVQSLSSQTGIRIRSSNKDTAYVDLEGKTMYIPNIHVDYNDYKAFRIVKGYVDHEIGHLLYTSPKLKFQKPLVNLLEDIRVEYKLSKKYIGISQDLHILNLSIIQDGGLEGVSHEDTLSTMMSYLFIRGLNIMTEIIFNVALVSKYETYIKPLIKKVQGTRCLKTEDYAVELIEILKRLYGEEPDGITPPNKSEGPGTGSDSTDGDVVKIPLQDFEKVLEDIIKDLDIESSISSKMKEVIKDEPDGSKAHVPASYQEVILNPYSQKALEDAKSTSLSSEGQEDTINKYSSLFNMFLSSTAKVRRLHSSVGRFNAKKSYKLTTGAQNMYTRTVLGRTFDYEVFILTDCSGSMRGSKLRVSSVATYVITKALSQCQDIRTALYGFTADFDEKKAAAYEPDTKVSGHNNILYRFKDLDDALPEHFDKLPSIMYQGLPTKNNFDYAALSYANKLLSASKSETKKMILVISDGSPHSSLTSSKAVLKEYIDSLRAKYNIFGIGLGTDCVTDLYGEKHSVVINDLEDIAGSMFSAIKEFLVSTVVTQN